MKENNFFGLSKMNFLLIGISFVMIIIGFVLMAGVKSGEMYNPEIFAPKYITVAPMVSLFGFVCMIFSILYRTKK